MAVFVFLLSWENLLKFYKFVLTLFLVVLSYQLNMKSTNTFLDLMADSVNSILQSLLSLNFLDLYECKQAIGYITLNYISQAVIGVMYLILSPNFQNGFLSGLILISFVLPSFLLTLPVPHNFQLSLPVFTALTVFPTPTQQVSGGLKKKSA